MSTYELGLVTLQTYYHLCDCHDRFYRMSGHLMSVLTRDPFLRQPKNSVVKGKI